MVILKDLNTSIEKRPERQMDMKTTEWLGMFAGGQENGEAWLKGLVAVGGVQDDRVD